MEKEKAEVALMVATKFVENFYPVLADTPYMLHNFYHESARFTFTIGSDDPETVYGKEAIFTRIADLYFDDVRMDIASGSLDVQVCEGSDDIMLMVTGTISKKMLPPMPFVQTLLLGKSGDDNYSIKNDVWRLLDKNNLLKSCDQELHGNNRFANSAEDAREEKTETIVTTEVNVEAAVEDKSCSSEIVEEKMVEEEKEEVEEVEEDSKKINVATPATATTTKVEVAVAAASSRPVEERKTTTTYEKISGASPASKGGAEEKKQKASWAAMAGKTAAAPTKRAATASASKPTTTTAKTAPVRKVTPERKKTPARRVGGQLHVKKIGADTTESLLRGIYESFGKIVEIKLDSRGFGVISYESADAVAKVLAAQKSGSISCPFVVEERHRRGKSGGGSGSGGGRGGFRGNGESARRGNRRGGGRGSKV
eukprot:g2080.t1